MVAFLTGIHTAISGFSAGLVALCLILMLSNEVQSLIFALGQYQCSPKAEAIRKGERLVPIRCDKSLYRQTIPASVVCGLKRKHKQTQHLVPAVQPVRIS